MYWILWRYEIKRERRSDLVKPRCWQEGCSAAGSNYMPCCIDISRRYPPSLLAIWSSKLPSYRQMSVVILHVIMSTTEAAVAVSKLASGNTWLRKKVRSLWVCMLLKDGSARTFVFTGIVAPGAAPGRHGDRVNLLLRPSFGISTSCDGIKFYSFYLQSIDAPSCSFCCYPPSPFPNWCPQRSPGALLLPITKHGCPAAWGSTLHHGDSRKYNGAIYKVHIYIYI